MSTYIIYKTTNLVNGKIYVGQHNTSADDGYLGSGVILEKAIKKYGKDIFVRETIEFCTSSNVNEKEVYWVDKLNATNPDIGYNITKGGEGGITWIGEHPNKGKEGFFSGHQHSIKTREQMSLFRKGKRYVDLMSEEKSIQKRINHSNFLKGKPSGFSGKKHDEKSKIKMKEARKGKTPNLGKKFTEEHKRKISESLKNRKRKNYE